MNIVNTVGYPIDINTAFRCIYFRSYFESLECPGICILYGEHSHVNCSVATCPLFNMIGFDDDCIDENIHVYQTI